MRCLVLGAGGLIAGHLITRLIENGHEVIAYDRTKNPSGFLSNNPAVTSITGNFTTEQRWNEILEGVHLCYHLISTTVPKTSNEAPVDDVADNVIGTLHLLKAIQKYNIRLVFSSSGGTVYGAIKTDPISEQHPTNPLCSYGITKLTIEKYLLLYRELHGIESVVLRIANPYGEGQRPLATQGAVAVFMGRVLQGHVIDLWGDGSIVRDYIYIEDVIDALLTAANYRGQHTIFNIGSGAGVSLIEVIRMIENVLSKKANIVFHPSRSFDVPKNVLDISLARSEFPWSPKTSMQDGLVRTANWMQHHYIDLK